MIYETTCGFAVSPRERGAPEPLHNLLFGTGKRQRKVRDLTTAVSLIEADADGMPTASAIEELLLRFRKRYAKVFPKDSSRPWQRLKVGDLLRQEGGMTRGFFQARFCFAAELWIEGQPELPKKGGDLTIVIECRLFGHQSPKSTIP